jgi:hypothetical protein
MVLQKHEVWMHHNFFKGGFSELEIPILGFSVICSGSVKEKQINVF